MNLGELKLYLERTGYAELCSSFNPLKPRPSSWANARDCLTSRTLLRFLDLLLLGKVVDKGRFSDTELVLLAPLVDHGLMFDDGDSLRTNDLCLYVVLGIWTFFELPKPDPKIYYGDDSFALLNRLRPLAGGDTLDLCAGPGIQSLYCARLANTVTSVEINPFAAAIAMINREMNGARNWEILTGDLYRALPTDRCFDHVVCNPPLLPFPEDESYPFVGNGGIDGWKVAWQVLDGLPQRLRAGGRAQLIGTTLGDGVVPMIAEPLRRWAADNAMDCQLVVVAQRELARDSPWFEGLAYSSAASSGRPIAMVRDRFQRFLTDQAATHLVSHYLHVSHGAGELEIIDLFADEREAEELWYV